MKSSFTAVTQRKDLLALAILVLISVVVRLPGVFNRAIWYDEAITLLESAGNAFPTWSALPKPAATQKELLVGSPTFGEVAAGLRETDVHPPVYYGLLSVWRRITGESIEAARLFSVVWSTASVVLLFLLLRAFEFRRPFWPSLVYSLSSGAVHYSHEARNYSLAIFLVMMVTLLVYKFSTIDFDRRIRFWIFSFSIAVCCCLSFLTNYLTIFPIVALFTWCLAWTPKKQRRFVLPAIVFTVVLSLIGINTLLNQLGARPKQFQKVLGFGQELMKIIESNFQMLWSPVAPSSGIYWTVVGTTLVLSFLCVAYVRAAWSAIDRRLLTIMVGLAISPSLGLLALDLLFSKSLGKSSYVLFGLPGIIVLLTLALGDRSEPQPGQSRWSAANLARIVGFVVPFFIGLQLSGINFDLERTPRFPGSTLRSLAGRIEASSQSPVVVIGAGHGRGDPASVIYELEPETSVCVVDTHSDFSRLISELDLFDDIWIVFAKGRMTTSAEQSLFEALTEGDVYAVISQTKRFAHLKKARQQTDGD